jgi:hypothetical protein
MTLHD